MKLSIVSVCVMFAFSSANGFYCGPPLGAPVQVVYQGEACECAKSLPYQVETPKITEFRDTHVGYGYKVERPQHCPEEVKYSFDFRMERPKAPSDIELGSHGYQVIVPPKPCENNVKYNFDYQLQLPNADNKHERLLSGLYANIDKVVLPRKDCAIKIEGDCPCRSSLPLIEYLPSCPKHGHLAAVSRRYEDSIKPQYFHRNRPPIRSRSKRSVSDNLTFRKYFAKNFDEGSFIEDDQVIEEQQIEKVDNVAEVAKVDTAAKANKVEKITPEDPLAVHFAKQTEYFLNSLSPQLKNASEKLKTTLDGLLSNLILRDDSHRKKRNIQNEFFERKTTTSESIKELTGNDESNFSNNPAILQYMPEAAGFGSDDEEQGFSHQACPNCGSKNISGSFACPLCGSNLKKHNKIQSQPQIPPHIQSQPNPTPQPIPQPQLVKPLPLSNIQSQPNLQPLPQPNLQPQPQPLPQPQFQRQPLPQPQSLPQPQPHPQPQLLTQPQSQSLLQYSNIYNSPVPDIYPHLQMPVVHVSSSDPYPSYQQTLPTQSQYIEFVQGQPIPYDPIPNNFRHTSFLPSLIPQQQPRIVFDRLGHRYQENNGHLRLVSPATSITPDPAKQEMQVGSPYGSSMVPGQYYETLQNIFNQNKETMDKLNLPGPGHSIQEPVELAIDTLDFIKEIANDKNSPNDYITTYDSSAYDTVGSIKELVSNVNNKYRSPGAGPSKRSYEIIPLVQNNGDGSVFVKIAPKKRAAIYDGNYISSHSHTPNTYQHQKQQLLETEGYDKIATSTPNMDDLYRQSNIVQPEPVITETSNDASDALDNGVVAIDNVKVSDSKKVDNVSNNMLTKEDIEVLKFIYKSDMEKNLDWISNIQDTTTEYST